MCSEVLVICFLNSECNNTFVNARGNQKTYDIRGNGVQRNSTISPTVRPCNKVQIRIKNERTKHGIPNLRDTNARQSKRKRERLSNWWADVL